jgi:hypothetical protein
MYSANMEIVVDVQERIIFLEHTSHPSQTESTVSSRQSEHGHSESSATSNTIRLPLKTPIYL